MTVRREDLERSLRQVRRQVADPRVGLLGPESISWRIDREAIVFLAGGRAALLQLAHPAVAAGVDQHSRTRDDPIGRFQRTFSNVFAMVFGDLDHAIASARRVHAIHNRVTGVLGEAVGDQPATTRYEANDEASLLWVHATLVDSALRAYELVVEPLSGRDRSDFYEESRRVAALFGLGPDSMPESYPAFVRYNESMWKSLVVSSAARELSSYLLSAAPRGLGPLEHWYRGLAAGLLPPPIRSQYGLRFGRREAFAFRASLSALRAAYPHFPPAFRYCPAYRDAGARLRGEPPPRGLSASWSRRLFTGGP